MLQPNYRGSTGYGEASIQSLPGKAGTNDVADCMAALKAAIDKGECLSLLPITVLLLSRHSWAIRSDAEDEQPFTACNEMMLDTCS